MSGREIKFRIKTSNNEWNHFDCLYNEAVSADLGDCKRETLGQYIGIKDSNGIDIYEGDVVQFIAYERNGVVGYDAPHFCVINFEKKEAYSIVENSCVVIGNIYDNKNLIKNEKQTSQVQNIPKG